MLDAIVDAVITAVSAEGINAVAKYPSEGLDPTAAVVCVSLKSARLTASGCGDYIGIGSVDGSVVDMYGSRADFVVALDIYSPVPDVSETKNSIYLALYGVNSMTLRSFESSDTVFDPKSGMFLCRCEAAAASYLVRYTSNMRPVYRSEEI